MRNSVDRELEANPWHRFLRKSEADVNAVLYTEQIAGKTILVTGGGGWIGSALCMSLADSGANNLVLLDLAEGALYEAHLAIIDRGKVRATPVLGSVCDAACLRSIFLHYRPQLVFHAAAYKHVPLGERNPFALIENNAVGTATLVEIASAYPVERLVMVSTDKAVEPTSIMGASKRIGELALFRHNHSGNMCAVRLGNVFDSPGSVAPMFRAQIARGGPVTVTHHEAKRYFMTIGEATTALASALDASAQCDLMIPALGDALRVADLAGTMIGSLDVPIIYGALRPGDKMEEALFARDESPREPLGSGLYPIDSPRAVDEELDASLTLLKQAIVQHDLDLLIKAVQLLVPAYRPSPLILEQLVDNMEGFS